MTTLTIEELLVRESIRCALETYTSAGDRGAMDELVWAFVPDARLELFGRAVEGRDAIADALGSVIADPGSLGFLRHHLTSSKIELTGTGADGWTYFIAFTPLGPDHCGLYVDHFVDDGDAWRIARRRIKVDWCHPDSPVLGADDDGWWPRGWSAR